MCFDSLSFILIFLPAALLLYYITPRRAKNLILFALSLVFYAWGDQIYVVLLVLSVLFNYLSGMEIERKEMEGRSGRAPFVIAVAGNVLILILFKYSGLFLDMLNRILHANIVYHSPGLPLGLVFFTLQGISYLVDIRKGDVEAEHNFVNFGLFIGMFQKISMGPLVRYGMLRQQLRHRRESWRRFGDGVMYFIRGLSKKVILASTCGEMFSYVQNYASGSVISAATAWLGCIAFSFEIYFELGGYTDMAIGLGKMFGFDLPENFRYPYMASTFAEFWRKWHITFVSWVRDYIYEPLGGAKGGVVRVMLNLLISGALFGLLHGASLHYIVWGFYVGVLLFLERLLYAKVLRRFPGWLRRIFMLLLTAPGWVFFFSSSVKGALRYIGIMFTIGGAGIADVQAAYLLRSNFILLVICGIFSTPYAYRFFNGLCMRRGKEKVAVSCAVYLLLLFICIAFIVTGTGNYYVWN